MHSVMSTGSDILDQIMRHKAVEVNASKVNRPLAQLRAHNQRAEPCRGFVESLLSQVAKGDSAVIAEVKKASPSRGIIRPNFDPVAIAESYQQHGATCLSVLTDSEFFHGSSAYFSAVRNVVSLPMLRKDFILDPYQIEESRMMGADCILLIVAALEDGLMQDLALHAQQLGMDVLVEVHDQSELERGLKLALPMIGINNRNLRNFETSLHNTLNLLNHIPEDILVVTESGIHTTEDIQLMRDHGVSSFLVGEAFMRAENPGQQLAELFY